MRLRFPLPAEVVRDGLDRYDEGTMDEAEEVKMFQYLIDTGLVWVFSDKYRQRAAELIRKRRCREPMRAS